MRQIQKFNKELCKIKYGWYDKEGKLYESLREGNFAKNYRMQYIDEVKRHKSSICWDLCEVEREFFEKTNYPFMTVFAVLKKYKRKPCHTFLVFKNKGKYYWFEASWNKMKGVREYDSLEKIFDDIRDNFDEFTKNKDYDKKDIDFYKYGKPREGIGCNGFYVHCMYFGKKIKKDNKRFFK